MSSGTYRKPDPKGSKSVSAKFPPAVIREIDKDAKRLGLTRSNYIFVAATAKLARAPKAKPKLAAPPVY